MVQAVVEHARKLRWGIVPRQVRAPHVSEKQGVSGQHSPWIGSLLTVDNHQADTFRSVSRRLQHANAKPADAQLKTIRNRHVRKPGAGAGTHIDLRSSASGELLVSGDKVSMQMSFEDVTDRYVLRVRGFEVEINIALGIDHHSLSR